MSRKSALVAAIAAVLLIALLTGCSSPARTAKSGDNVTIDYILTLSNGTLLDTSYEQVARDGGIYSASREYAPLSFVIDNNTLFQGFNEAPVGMRAGETKNVTLPPEKAYGAYDASLIKPFAIRDIVGNGSNASLKVGQALFYSPDGAHMKSAYVYSIDEANDTVYVNYNHRLAGMTLTFQLTLRRIE